MLSIRHACAADAPALASFAAQAFDDSYRDIDEAQALAVYIAEHFTPDEMSRVIADPACTVLLAVGAGQLAGYAVLHDLAAPACVQGAAPIKLWRLYLAQAHTGQGLGRRLLHAAETAARERGARTLWLTVYDRNERAVRFYRRHGFQPVGTSEFLFGGEVYADPVYARSLDAEV